jgi:hypothetical protein
MDGPTMEAVPMNTTKLEQKKDALTTALLRALVADGFRSTRRLSPPHDGFEMMRKCKDPKFSLQIANRVIGILEANGFRVGLGDRHDMNIQFIKGPFYATIGVGRFGVTVYFEEQP